MARGQSDTLTEREAQIMGVIWRLGQATAEEVREALQGQPHDSTVRTLLRVLETKGYLTHEARGKAYVYSPAIARENAQRHALGSVLARFFGGSAEDLVLRLIEDERITPEQLDELRTAAPSAPHQEQQQGEDRPQTGKRRSKKGG